VSAPRILVTDGAQIASTSKGPGRGGSITVTASDTLTLVGSVTIPDGTFPSGIFADADGTKAGAGAAGTVVVSAPRILVTDGATISSGTGGPGHGGDVTVRASEALTITGRDAAGFSSEISSNTFGSGAAGRVTVTAPTLNIDDGLISSDSLPGSMGDAGTVVVEGRTITLSGGAQISSSTTGPGHGGDVTVRASEALTITAPGQDAGGFFVISGVFSNTFGSGAAGRVTVTVPTLRMDNGQITSECQGSTGDAGTVVVEGEMITLSGGAQISSGTFGAGRGGDVTVRVSEALTITGRRDADAFRSGVSSSTVGSGAAGRVTVTAPTLRMDDGVIQARAGQRPSGAAGSILTLQDAPDATGDAGSILITAGSITLTGGAQIDSRTGGRGQGGLIVVTATDMVSIGGSNRDGNPSGLVSLTSSTTAGAGDAGTVLLAAPHVQLTDGGQIQTSTSGAGNAGTIVVGAFEQQVDGMTIHGPQVEQVMLTGGAQITSSSGKVNETGTVVASSGRGGTVTVTTTDALIIAGHDPMGTEPSGVFSQTFGPGAAGSVTVTTPRLTLAEGGRISAETGSDGHGGDVTVKAGRLELRSGAQINGSSGITLGPTHLVGAGRGGTVTLMATDPVLLTGQGTGLFTRAAGPGEGGDITMQAPRVTLADGATISAESTGLGNAGKITLTLGDSFMSTHGSIVTRATQADGGDIQITAPNFLRLRDSTITAEVGGGATTVGGNIFIDPQFVLLQNSQIVANAFAGQGGKIRIQAQQVFLADPTSLVSASSALGINGQVAIQAPVADISGTVASLPQTFARVGELLRDRCVERVRGGTVSRFVLGGRDGVPLEPGSLLLSPLMRAEQLAPVRITDTVAGQREVSFGPVGGLESDNTSYLSLRGPHGQAQWLEALDVECARWRWMQGTDVKTAP
jgi:large exoprotein involved in heme utilization and adhesion